MEECGTLKGGLILKDISSPQKCAKPRAAAGFSNLGGLAVMWWA